MKSEKTKLIKGQKTSSSSGNHSNRGGSSEKAKINHANIDDDLVETDSDDTPSISSTTDSGTVSESDSGKSSPPSSFPDHVVHGHHRDNSTASPEHLCAKLQNEQQKITSSSSSNSIIDTNNDMTTSLYTSSSDKILKDGGNLADTSGNK